MKGIDAFFNTNHKLVDTISVKSNKKNLLLECHGCQARGWVELEQNAMAVICPICKGQGTLLYEDTTDVFKN